MRRRLKVNRLWDTPERASDSGSSRRIHQNTCGPSLKQCFAWLRDTIASIPIPLIFAKGEFESGVAAKRLAQYAEDPLPFLDSVTKKKLNEAYRELWRKFEDIAFGESAQTRYEAAMHPPADNLDLGPVTEADLHVDLFQPENQPF
jgi:hypothetical protein